MCVFIGLLVCWLSPNWCGFYITKRIQMVCSFAYPLSIEQSLEYSRCLINVYWTKSGWWVNYRESERGEFPVAIGKQAKVQEK
jgi:hypothetical protein